MNLNLTLEQIYDLYPDETFLSYDGLEDAVVGVDDSTPKRLILSMSKVMEILIGEGLTDEEAMEHIDFNVRGGYVGIQTPKWLDDYYAEGEPKVTDDWDL
jgi:hypothetical protein